MGKLGNIPIKMIVDRKIPEKSTCLLANTFWHKLCCITNTCIIKCKIHASQEGKGMSPATKILIVEDEDVLAENLKKFLNRSASNVRIAGDASDAIEVLKSFTPDIVVLDYGLPGMDGLQAYALIVHSRAPHASCVLISGQLTDDITRTSNEYGINHILSKPFSFLELQDMIDLSLDENPMHSISTMNALERTFSTRRHEQVYDSAMSPIGDDTFTNHCYREERRHTSERRQNDIDCEEERSTIFL
jgi:DNA-binding response OmpR family regulator